MSRLAGRLDLTGPTREQMLAIISPGWSAGTASLTIAWRHAFRKKLNASEVIHFASIVLLPPSGTSEHPSLLLELVVDEGLRPPDAIRVVVDNALAELSTLYAEVMPHGLAAGAARDWLVAYLLERTHIADCGYVGARDRSITQIRAERDFLERARTHWLARGHARHAGVSTQSRHLILEMTRWAAYQPEAEWAALPAGRSFWRARAASIPAKVVYFAIVWLLPVLLAVVGAWILVKSAIVGMWPWHWNLVDDLLSAARNGGKAALAVLAFLIAVKLAGNLVSVIPAWRKSVDAIAMDLDDPAWTIRAWLQHLLAYLVVAYLLLLIVGPASEALLASTRLATLVFAVITATIVIYSLLPVFAGPGRALRHWIDRRLVRPHDAAVPRAHQVHRSIESRESLQRNRTAHMVSLTDIRRPFFWNAFWLRFWLWLFMFLGRVAFTEGRLGDAPGIKFGHWHVIDGGRRLLFCTNYDGAFGGYLDDFINGASIGATSFWRWTELRKRRAADGTGPAVKHARRFPPTRLLLKRGVKCEQWFKTYARDSMLPESFYFTAYDLNNTQIDRATRFRDAAFGERTQVKDDRLLRALES